MAIDFPNSPTLNQVFTAGGQSWVWEGTKWNSMSSGFSDAPSDGNTYGRLNATWSSVNALLAPATQAGAGNTGRNLLHNPLFAISQRGAGPFTALNTFTLDRWAIRGTADTVSIIQNPLPDASRTQIGDEAANFSFNIGFTGSASGNSYLQQAIESVRRLAGKTVTVSFWANAGTAGLKLGVNGIQYFGTGGSPSGAVWILTTGLPVTLSTTMTRYSVTFAIPSVVGKTLGTNGDDYTTLTFWFSSQANTNALAGNIGVQSGGVNLWGVQLEIGNVMTALSKRDPADELQLCQRFYQANISMLLEGYVGGTQVVGVQIGLAVTMRATPTCTIVTNNSSNVSGVGVSGPSINNIQVTGTGMSAGQFTLWVPSITASADL